VAVAVAAAAAAACSSLFADAFCFASSPPLLMPIGIISIVGGVLEAERELFCEFKFSIDFSSLSDKQFLYPSGH
jgi:hypothetical protein